MSSIEHDDFEPLRAAYDLLPSPLWISTEANSSRWFNKAWLALTGRDEGAPYLSDWRADLEPSDAERLDDHEAQPGEGDARPRRASYRIRSKNGSFVRFEEISAPRFAQDGARLGYIGICHEKAERAHDGQAVVLDSHAQDAVVLKTLLNGILHHAVFLMDADGIVVTWNRGAEMLKGYSAEEILGKHYETFFTSEDRASGTPGDVLSRAASEGHLEVEGWRVRKGGDRFWAQVAIDSVRDADGHLQGFTKVARDITVQHETLASLEEARNRLFQAQKMEAIGQLTGGVAHDFNNLLTVILGNASRLQQELSENPPLRELAEITRQAAERGAALTNQLLAFARRQPLAPEPIDVKQTISAMGAFLKRTVGEEVEIEVIHADGLWLAMADPSRLESAMLNLCLNARDAMATGGKVTIETANVYLDELYANRHAEVKAGEYVMVAVSDTGPGMSPEVLDRAFEPFFTTKGPDKGSGLGLSMVHGFIKQSGGHIKIYTELGHGTTVKIYLPRSDAELANTPIESVPAHLLLVTRVLIVEDDEMVREYVTEEFLSLGCEVESVSNAREALAKLALGERFGLLFTDVVLPGMDGRKLADEARKLYPDLPVLFTSGYTENAIIHHGRLDRGVHLLTKPYRREDLVAKLSAVLGGPSVKT